MVLLIYITVPSTNLHYTWCQRNICMFLSSFVLQWWRPFSIKTRTLTFFSLVEIFFSYGFSENSLRLFSLPLVLLPKHSSCSWVPGRCLTQNKQLSAMEDNVTLALFRNDSFILSIININFLAHRTCNMHL